MRLLPLFTILVIVQSSKDQYTDELYGSKPRKKNETATFFSKEVIERYRKTVKDMFYHAYDGYLKYAYPLDELKPVSCKGQDTWGSFSLSLVDSLTTLIVLGNTTEFERAVDLVLKSVRDDVDINVSVFETNIRVVGGLISAHMLAGKVPEMVEKMDGWPCDGPLLRLAVKMADRLVPAFNTDTGMPYGTVNLRFGVHKDETPITCTAAVGTYILEFGTLSRLTGDEKYEKIALKALDSLWTTRSPIGLVGNHINVMTSQWTATDSGIGAGIDSYFEYLAKGAFLFKKPSLMKQFNEYVTAINKHVRKDDWFMWVSMTKGTVSMPVFQSLEAFWPGVLTLVGDIQDARRIMLQYSQVLHQYGVPPEFYHIHDQAPIDKRAAYPLRPEIAESLMYLYRATRDEIWLELGAQMIDTIETAAKTDCGYGTVHDVREHSVEDRMESFFLAETTKYLYLLFDPENFIHDSGIKPKKFTTKNNVTCAIYGGGYIFNTEAHPIDPGMLDCCSNQASKSWELIRKWESYVDLMDILNGDGIGKNGDSIKADLLDQVEVERYLRQTEGGEKYYENQYGSKSVVEFEVDESLKKEAEELNKKHQEEEKLFAQIKHLLRTRMHLDEERRKQGKKSNDALELLKKLQNKHHAYSNRLLEVYKLAMEEFEVKRTEDAIDEVLGSIEYPQYFCPDCCVELDEKSSSILYRFFLSDIYEYHLYPARRMRFEQGPICWRHEQPKIEDNYKNEPPVIPNLPRTEPDPSDLSRPELDELGYSLLLAPGPEFSDQFLSGVEVAPKKEKSWYFDTTK